MKRATSSWSELHPDTCPERIDAEQPEILVEVPECRRQRDGLDTVGVRPFDQHVPRAITRRIVVTNDIEPPQRRREQDAGRDALPRAPAPSPCRAEPGGATAWSRCLRPPPSRCRARPMRTALPRRSPIACAACRSGAVAPEPSWCEPGAVRARDLVIEVGDRRDHAQARFRSDHLSGL